MKHLYTLFFLCIALAANAQLNIPSPPPYTMCDSDGDEVATFDLTNYANVILGDLSPQDYTVSYYETFQSAQDQSSSIQNPTAYNNVTAVQILYARVAENSNPNNFAIVLVDLRVEPAPVINQPAPITVCDSDSVNDGVRTINLTYNAEQIIAGCNSCMITYYQTDDFNDHIANPESYTASGSQTLYIKVSNVITQCEAFTTMTVSVLPRPEVVTLPVIYAPNCYVGEYDLTLNNNFYNPLHEVSFYATESDANAATNAIVNPTIYLTTETRVWVRVANVPSDANAPTCFTILQQLLTYRDITQLSATIVGQTAVFNATGTDPFTYTIITAPIGFTHALPYQTSNVITNLPLGRYTIQIEDVCGNVRVVTFSIIDIDAPTGETNQTFTQGETLADLEVSGGGGPIEWYDAPTGGNLLPITTLLVDDTTYYAERSSGTFRANRLAVTVNLVLSNSSNTLQTLTYFPNPVNNILTLKNASAINSISVYNALGQQVLSKGLDATNAVVDLSALNAGIYFVKVQAGENGKTLRIIKE
jgi:hypothetical protein